MPNKTLYINTENWKRLGDEIINGPLINDLLAQYGSPKDTSKGSQPKGLPAPINESNPNQCKKCGSIMVAGKCLNKHA